MFKNLDEFYYYIETQTQLIKDNFLSSKISEILDNTTSENIKKALFFEMYFEDYNMNEAKLSLSDEAIEYLILRVQNIQNPKLKAKYNHILWQKTKNTSYAKIAIDNYLTFLRLSNFKIEDNLDNQAFAKFFSIVFLLAQEIKYKKDDVLGYLIEILEQQKINGYQECASMMIIAKNGKNIPKEILQKFFNYSNKVIDNSTHPDFLKYYLELQIILAQKIGQQLQVYQNKLGDYYVQKANAEDSFVVQDQYIKALEQYKKAGNAAKFEEVSVLIQKSKSNLNFAKTEIKIEDDSLQDMFDRMNKEIDILISQLTPKEIYEHLMLSTDIFPEANLLDVEVLPATFELVHVMVFDGNGNLNSKAKGGIRPYAIQVQNFSLTFLQWVFFKGIKSGKLSFETLYEYLLKSTWYGDDMAYINNERNPETFKWLDILAPSLESFFTQMEKDIYLGVVNNSAYQLAIDSLALKFEGLLRAFSEKMEAQTLDLKDSETQERISFEKLFDNPKFKNVVPADDIALFKYLFTNQGMNLRNNVAHCFYKPKNYSVAIMWFLIVAILRLGNFKFQKIIKQ